MYPTVRSIAAMLAGESSRWPSGAAKTTFTLGAVATFPASGKFSATVSSALMAGVPSMANSSVKGFIRDRAPAAAAPSSRSQATITRHLCRYDQRPSVYSNLAT